VTLALRSCCEIVEYSFTNLRFASFNGPYNPVRLIYEKKLASIQILILRLMVPKIRQLHKNGNSSEYFYGHEKAATIVLIGFTKHY